MADSVKSQPKRGRALATGPVRPLRHFRLLAGAGWCLVLSLNLLATDGSAQSLLLGPAARRVRAKVEWDPRLPSGTLRRSSLAVDLPDERACSLQLPICVAGHLQSTSSALSLLETAYRRIVYAAGLPAPLRTWEPDYGSPAVTWILTPDTQPLATQLVPSTSSAFESAAVVCRSGAASASDAALERTAHLCIGEAIAARLDAAESPRSRRAFAQTLWWQIGQPREADILEVARSNAQPYRAAVGRDQVTESTSTALLFEYLEQSLGTRTPFALLTGLFAVSGQPRKLGTLRYPNEPDWLDVIRESLGDDRVDFAHRVNAFGAARSQLGAPTGPLDKLAWVGSFARVRPDWDIAVSSLPRRVASKKPIEPLGITVTRIAIDVPTKDLSLAIHVEWEAPVPFTWTVVKLDPNEHEIGRLDLAFEPRVTSAEKRIVALDGIEALLVIGTNLGGIDATHLLDPDHAPFEPHGCTIYVARL